MTEANPAPQPEETEQTEFDQEFVQNQIVPMLMSDKAYNIVKWIVQYILPGLTVLYAIIANSVGIPYTDVVMTILVAVDWFLGIIMGISTNQYNKAMLMQKK